MAHVRFVKPSRPTDGIHQRWNIVTARLCRWPSGALRSTETRHIRPGGGELSGARKQDALERASARAVMQRRQTGAASNPNLFFLIHWRQYKHWLLSRPASRANWDAPPALHACKSWFSSFFVWTSSFISFLSGIFSFSPCLSLSLSFFFCLCLSSFRSLSPPLRLLRPIAQHRGASRLALSEKGERRVNLRLYHHRRQRESAFPPTTTSSQSSRSAYDEALRQK